jgi:periplasmic protein TonB
MSEAQLRQWESFRIWVLAALGAGALHAGCAALALEYLRSGEDEALGAPAIEIGLEVTTLRRTPDDLPPGPDADASIASPTVPEQQAVVEPTDLPKAVPTENADPERLVTPDDSKRPKDDSKIATMATAPSTGSIAAEATAPPSSETIPEAPRSVTPAQGTGDSAQRVRATWQKELAAHFDKHKRYPSDRARQSAEISVNFVLDRAGHIVSSRIVQGSGDASFDAAALAMLQRSDPVPQHLPCPRAQSNSTMMVPSETCRRPDNA